MSNTKPKIGLALGSGGARGWAHVGVIQALQELGIKPSYISGTSIGALVGAVYACGHFDALVKLKDTLDWKKAAQLFMELNLPTSGLISGKRIIDLLQQDDLIGKATFDDLQIPLQVIATDLKQEKAITLSKGSVLNAVRASISIPGIFTPIAYEDGWLIDGGLTNPLPIEACREMGADYIIAVDINLRSRHVTKSSEKMPSIFEVLTRTVRLAENAITQRTLFSAAPDLVIQPVVGQISTLDFQRSKIAIAEGERAVKAHAAELKGLLS